jgi:DNA-directed RNA polymerase subunit K/omega
MSDVSDESYDDEEDIDINTFEETISSKEITVVKNENRVTSQRLSLYEQTALVNKRARQISTEGVLSCMVNVDGLVDVVSMAKRELMMRKTPLMLSRTVGYVKNEQGVLGTYCEDWDPNTMEFSVVYTDI